MPLIGIGSRDASVAVASAPRGRRQAAIAGGVIAVLIAVLAVIDRGRSEPSANPIPATTSPSSTSTSTTPTIPIPTTAAPTTTSSTLPPNVLGEATGIKLLVQMGRRSVLVDLDAGTSTAAPPNLTGYVLTRDGGAVVQGPSSSISFVHAPYDGAPVSISAMPSGQLLASAALDRVWLLSPSDPPLRVAEVTTSGEITQMFDLPGDGYPAGAVDGGIVQLAHGSMYVIRGDGDITPIGAGDVVATSARSIAAISCDVAARCSLTLIDAVSGRRRPVDIHGRYGGQGGFSPDGRWLTFVSQDPSSTPAEWIVDVRTAKARRANASSSFANGAPPAFSPDSRWTFNPSGDGVDAIGLEDGVLVHIPLGLASGEANQVVVLP